MMGNIHKWINNAQTSSRKELDRLSTLLFRIILFSSIQDITTDSNMDESDCVDPRFHMGSSGSRHGERDRQRGH